MVSALDAIQKIHKEKRIPYITTPSPLSWIHITSSST